MLSIPLWLITLKPHWVQNAPLGTLTHLPWANEHQNMTKIHARAEKNLTTTDFLKYKTLIAYTNKCPDRGIFTKKKPLRAQKNHQHLLKNTSVSGLPNNKVGLPCQSVHNSFNLASLKSSNCLHAPKVTWMVKGEHSATCKKQ